MNINHKAARKICSLQGQYAGQPIMRSTLAWVMKQLYEILEYMCCPLDISQGFGTLSQHSSYL